MRITLGCLAYLALTLAGSQELKPGSEPVVSPPARAPLASPDELEPTADVSNIMRPGMPRAAPAPAPSAPGAPAAPAAPAQPAAASGVVDRLDLGTTSITGNQELPKVLYIVPWKKADLGDLVGRPVNTLLDEVLEPVDPDVFERHLEYYESLYGSSNKE